MQAIAIKQPVVLRTGAWGWVAMGRAWLRAKLRRWAVKLLLRLVRA